MILYLRRKLGFSPRSLTDIIKMFPDKDNQGQTSASQTKLLKEKTLLFHPPYPFLTYQMMPCPAQSAFPSSLPPLLPFLPHFLPFSFLPPTLLLCLPPSLPFLIYPFFLFVSDSDCSFSIIYFYFTEINFIISLTFISVRSFKVSIAA